MIIDQPLKKLFSNKYGKDSNVKSLLKSISWRIVGTIDTVIISFFITGEFMMALSIGSVEVFSKIILYYFHERVWESAPKIKSDDTQKEYA
ncbi:DUF2061 domain-containing protein [Algoriphagus sp. SE2]|uniref:DUF2061 domain-containing protein n=1 Tax=Algoriphagus sp. SE2 TaxID=3141536 RepID=UPI0031CD81EE